MDNYSANNSRTTTAYVKVMTDAKDIAAKYGVKYIASEFLLAAILSANSNCSQTLKAYGITPVSYYKRLSDNIDVTPSKNPQIWRWMAERIFKFLSACGRRH